MIKTVLITGATGMVGGIVLQECLNSPDIKKVVSIVRRPSGVEHKKFTEVIHNDFLDYSKIEKHFNNIDIAYYCIGVYTGAVPRDEFREITVDYTKVFAKTLKKHSPDSTFCFLSGAGADRKEKSRMMFAQDKGIAENFLLKQNFGALHIFRPGYIYPVTPRKEPNFSYKISRFLYPLLKRIMPNAVIQSTDLARAMFITGLNDGDKDTYENKEIRKLVIKKKKQSLLKRVLKKIALVFLALLGVIIIAALIFINTSPLMGGKLGPFDSPNYKDGKFQNLVPTTIYAEDASIIKSMKEYFFEKSSEIFPEETLPTKKIDLNVLQNLNEDEVSVTWLGHSTTLITTKNLNIITDPVLIQGNIPPLGLGPKPFPYSTTYSVEDLPKIDVVLISHDHMDHLDMETVIKLRESKFYVPLGIKTHLLSWGISEKNIQEFDWYEGGEHSENLKLTLTPARHFSGRNPLKGDSTLWGSWVINLNGKTIYFGGDSGYFEEFKKIGNKFGPFDIVMLDAGQYDEAWQPIHMLPEEVVQAAMDLQAKTVMPIHNSKYVLSRHAWYDPLELTLQAGEKNNMDVTTPVIGEICILGKDECQTRWWR